MSGSEEMTAGPVPGVREEVNAFLTREGVLNWACALPAIL